MNRRRFPTFLTAAAALLALTWGSGAAYAGNGNNGKKPEDKIDKGKKACLLYTSPSPRD